MRGYRITGWPTRFSLLLVALLLSSCSRVRVTSPLSDPDKAKPDEQLCGVWKAVPSNKEVEESGDYFLFIGKVGRGDVPAGIMKGVGIGIDSKKIVGDMPLYFFTTSIGDNNYASLFEKAVFDQTKFPTWNKRNIKEFALYKYKVEGDKLMVWWEKNDDAVEAAVRKGELKGMIEEKGSPKVITLTNGEDLSRFLAKGGDKLFFLEKSKIVYSRVK